MEQHWRCMGSEGASCGLSV